MKQAARLAALLLVCLQIACSGDVDNTEPPAPLTDLEAPLPLALNWQLDTRAASNEAAYRLRPLLVGQRVYSIDTGGTITSVDVENGRRNWRFETGLAPITGLGGNAELLIATSKDGDVVAYKVTEAGLEQSWSVNIGSEIRAPVVVEDDAVFVRSVDGKLRALAASDGAQRWVLSRRVPSLSLTGSSAPLVAGEFVFAGFDDGKLLAVDRADGQTIWEATISLPSGRTEVERLVDIDGDLVLRDGIIYVAAFQGRLAAVQAVSGDQLWSRELSSYQAIAIDDDALYLASDNSHIWSIDRRTGAAFWKQDVLNARRITAPSIIGDKLVVADLDGYLHWFNKADGRLVSRIRPSSSRNYVQPLIWQQSVLTLDRDGKLTSVSLLAQ